MDHRAPETASARALPAGCAREIARVGPIEADGAGLGLETDGAIERHRAARHAGEPPRPVADRRRAILVASIPLGSGEGAVGYRAVNRE
jgi:hypothetical protein